MAGVERYAEAYKMLAELGYRPAAPSDGLGNITVPIEELDLEAEAMEYARRFAEEEDSHRYWAGCTDYTFSRAAILALEAFRLMNGGLLGDPLNPDWDMVPAILRKAAEEYEREFRKDRLRRGR